MVTPDDGGGGGGGVGLEFEGVPPPQPAKLRARAAMDTIRTRPRKQRFITALRISTRISECRFPVYSVVEEPINHIIFCYICQYAICL